MFIAFSHLLNWQSASFLSVCVSVWLANPTQPICKSIRHAPCLAGWLASLHSKSTHILKHSQIEVSPLLGTRADAFGYKLDRNVEWWVIDDDWAIVKHSWPWNGTTKRSCMSYLDLGRWTAQHDVFEAKSLHMLSMLTQNLDHIRVWNKIVVNLAPGLFSRIIKAFETIDLKIREDHIKFEMSELNWIRSKGWKVHRSKGWKPCSRIILKNNQILTIYLQIGEAQVKLNWNWNVRIG